MDEEQNKAGSVYQLYQWPFSHRKQTYFQQLFLSPKIFVRGGKRPPEIQLGLQAIGLSKPNKLLWQANMLGVRQNDYWTTECHLLLNLRIVTTKYQPKGS